VPVVGALGAESHVPSTPHWLHKLLEADCTQVRVGTERPSVAELQYG
jgi:hypothetical protein